MLTSLRPGRDALPRVRRRMSKEREKVNKAEANEGGLQPSEVPEREGERQEKEALNLNSEFEESSSCSSLSSSFENPDRFAIRLTEQISCRTSVSLPSGNPNAPRTSTTTRTRTIPNFGTGLKRTARDARERVPL